MVSDCACHDPLHWQSYEHQGRADLSGRRCHGFKSDVRHLRSQGDKVQLLKANNLAVAILHEDHIVAGFLAEVLLIGIS